MKKNNPSYLAVWAGIHAVAAVVLAVLAFTAFMNNKTAFVICVFGTIGLVVAIPMLLESRMKKSAASPEEGFSAQGFNYQYKLEAENAV